MAQPWDTASVSGAARIMVVDDSVQVLALVRSILKSEGYDVTTAESGATALRLASEQHFDLILMDATMPGMSGFDACVELKAMPEHARTPIVFLTGMSDRQTYQQALEAGGDDFLSKPISRAGLIVRVRALLRFASQGDPSIAADALRRVARGLATLSDDPRLHPDLRVAVGELANTVRRAREG